MTDGPVQGVPVTAPPMLIGGCNNTILTISVHFPIYWFELNIGIFFLIFFAETFPLNYAFFNLRFCIAGQIIKFLQMSSNLAWIWFIEL